MSLTVFEAEQLFPWSVPRQEGPVMKIDRHGNWYLLFQNPGLTLTEKAAFQQKLQTYGYLETESPVPIAEIQIV